MFLINGGGGGGNAVSVPSSFDEGMSTSSVVRRMLAQLTK